MSYPNQEQSAVLRHLDGTLLVLAPAGTGKTRLMADRLAKVIETGMPPDHTLGVTFTNRAAEQMREAVKQYCGDHAKNCRIQTFHGLCAWILRIEARDIGLPSDFVIYDEEDSIDLMRECLRGTGETPEAAYWQLSQLKSDCPFASLTLAETPALNLTRFSEHYQKALNSYHQQLADRHALDFADLVYRTRAMFARYPEKRKKWGRRFRWIQMDEVQDTHLSEYEIIRILAAGSTGIAFFGDLDQTIYEWRGSKPDEVIKRLRADFGPISEIPLVYNYRATKALLRVADRHAATLKDRRTHNCPASTLPEGQAPEVHHAPHPSAEADWIANRLRSLLAEPSTGRIGILTRTHKRAEAVSNALTSYGVPHLTVEEFDFFRRQEIKDLLARLRLLLNPSDSGSLKRVTQRPSTGIGDATLRSIWTDGQLCGLRVTDFAQLRTHQQDEPFRMLLDALDNGTVVVFDVETTGLSPTDDEVIDLGAVKLEKGRPVAEFDTLLRPNRPIGASAAIHGISEETLFTEGRDAAEVFCEFASFAEGAVLVGHNVGFDLSMIRAHAARLGIHFPTDHWDDTHDLARRLLNLERYNLSTVSEHLETRTRPSHRALADARSTSEILMELGCRLEPGATLRREIVSRHGALFLPVARQLDSWRSISSTLRPSDLCERILRDSGLDDHYKGEPQRIANLRRFVQFFHEHDDPARPPDEMLADLTRRVSLCRNLDFLSLNDNSIPILTVHQSKGLEFDTVFVAGMTDDEFPSYYAKRDGKLEEEKRLFYVAITRAKRHLLVTSHRKNEWGWSKNASSFLRSLFTNALERITLDTVRRFIESPDTVDLSIYKFIDDDAARILGEHSAANRIEKYISCLFLDGLVSLSPVAAQCFSKCSFLCLNGLHQINDELANALAMHSGDLYLGGLRNLSDKEAESLSKHKGGLVLGITSLSESTAKWLARHQGTDICLPHMTNITDRVAEILAEYHGGLNLSGLTHLTHTTACILSKINDSLGLGGITNLTLDEVEALSNHQRGWLSLDGITHLGVEAAVVLSRHRALLSLNGLTHLSHGEARALSWHQGALSFNGLTNLNDTVAEALAMHQGALSFNGLTSLSDTAAEALSRHRGKSLFLDGLTTLSTGATVSLSHYNGTICSQTPESWLKLKKLISDS